MNIDITMVLTGIGTLIMLYCLWFAINLRARIPGGVVGKKWGQMTMMVGFFTLGYIALPFLDALSEQAMRLAIAMIFLFGALYVTITIRLIHRVIEELTA